MYTVELHIGKVVLGDRGDYRLEVKAKDVCDSCSFNVDVEGMLGQRRGRWRVDAGVEVVWSHSLEGKGSRLCNGGDKVSRLCVEGDTRLTGV